MSISALIMTLRADNNATKEKLATVEADLATTTEAMGPLRVESAAKIAAVEVTMRIENAASLASFETKIRDEMIALFTHQSQSDAPLEPARAPPVDEL